MFHQGWSVSSGCSSLFKRWTVLFEVAWLVDIGNERRLRRPPSQLLLCLRARSGGVERREMRDPSEMIGRLFRRFADDRDIQSPPNHSSDLAELDALIGDRMVSRRHRALFQRKPV